MLSHFASACIGIVLLCASLSSCSAISSSRSPNQPSLSGRLQYPTICNDDDAPSTNPTGSAAAFVVPSFRKRRREPPKPKLPITIDDGLRNSEDEKQITDHYHLTILLPAYNERHRIGSTLSSYVDYLRRTPVYQHHHLSSGRYDSSKEVCSEAITSGSVSILVVDDGSNDGTADFIRGKSWSNMATSKDDDDMKTNCWIVDENVICVSLPENGGKGAAIERGMTELPSFCSDTVTDEHLNLVKSIVLVADADGSGDISCMDNMIQSLEDLLSLSTFSRSTSLFLDQPPALVVGYRQYPQEKSPLRALLSWGFRTCVSILFLGSTNLGMDTQCGFKLMTASAGKVLYNQLNLRRWTHDVEVVHRARLLGVPVGECGVSWTDKDGSKLVTKASDAVGVSLAMLSEIAKMRVRYALGLWKVADQG